MSTKASLDQAKQVLALLAGRSTDQVQQIIGNGDLLRILMESRGLHCVDRDEFRSLVNPFVIAVDYRQTVEEMVEAGSYCQWNADIVQKHFPHDREGNKTELKVELVHFNRLIESDDAITELDKLGLRPVNSAELLTFGAAYPDVQREFPVVALGSPWVLPDGRRVDLFLEAFYGDRGLSLSCGGMKWSECYRFAAVRKSDCVLPQKQSTIDPW